MEINLYWLLKNPLVNHVKIIVYNCSMEYYMQKTYNKTASLVSNSCKAIAYVSNQKKEVATLAFEYGKSVVCKYPKILLLATVI